MKLRGYYDAGTEYAVGDLVKNDDGVVYVLQYPAPAGTNPKNTLYWGRADQRIEDAASLALDALDLAMGGLDKFFLNDQTLILKTGEGETETAYAITVDDSGETPELAVEEIVEDGEEIVEEG